MTSRFRLIANLEQREEDIVELVKESADTKTVVIVGGGFGGLSVARKLGDKHGVRVVLIDRRNYHLFQPLLYQVSMAALNPADIAVPIRTSLTSYDNAEVFLGLVESVDLKAKRIVTDFGPMNYDYLVLACGATHSYFGHPEWEDFAPGLKTLEQATEIRRRVLTAFEMAEREPDPVKQKELLTFVVVGGGPTGVELAGALGEISRYSMSKDFDHIDPRRTRVILIEAGPRILASFAPELSDRATRDLERLGVQVWTNSLVTDMSSEGVSIGNEVVRARTVLWAAGVRPSRLNAALGVPLDRQSRVLVERDLSLKEHPDVFVIGDQANAKDEEGKPLPGLAPVAMQQGRYVARTILGDLKGEARQPFHYRDKGQMATIGRKRAVVQTGSLKFGGTLAWLTWLFIHIYYLIGFRNRVLVFLQWAWSYFTFKRGARLITQKTWHLDDEESARGVQSSAS